MKRRQVKRSQASVRAARAARSRHGLGRPAVTGEKSRAASEAAPIWPLAVRSSIEAYDEYSDTWVELALGQRDPSRIEGLIIDFRYVSADHEVTRRSLLCWQCGRVGERIYVRGYCPFREELRTFRIDRMHDVIAFQDGREVSVEQIGEFFAAFAADEMDEDDDPPRLASRGG